MNIYHIDSNEDTLYRYEEDKWVNCKRPFLLSEYLLYKDKQWFLKDCESDTLTIIPDLEKVSNFKVNEYYQWRGILFKLEDGHFSVMGGLSSCYFHQNDMCSLEENHLKGFSCSEINGKLFCTIINPKMFRKVADSNVPIISSDKI